MEKAWIIRPLPMTVASPLGTDIGDPSYLANDHMGVIWGASGVRQVPIGAEFYHAIDFDLGADTIVDTILAFGMTGLLAGSRAKVFAATQAQGPFGGDSWFSPDFSPYAGVDVLPAGDLTLQWSAPLNGTPPAARYWRIVLITPERFNFQMKRVIIGKRFAPEVNFTTGAAFGVRDLGSLDFSPAGVLLRNRGARLRTVGLTFSTLFKDEVEAIVQPLLEYAGNTETIAVITEPDPAALRSRRTYFGTLVGDVGSVVRRANAYQVALNLVSLI